MKWILFGLSAAILGLLADRVSAQTPQPSPSAQSRPVGGSRSGSLYPGGSQPAPSSGPTKSTIRPQPRIYWVYYRSGPTDAWRCYGGYYHANDALYVMNYFRYHGYDSYYG